MSFPRYPKYKDSGVEWLGQVPEHWDTTRLKNLFHLMKRLPEVDDGIVTAFRDGEVTLRSNRRVDGFTNAIQEHGYQRILKGDLVIHAMDAFAGAIGVSDSDGKSTPVYSVCTPKNSKINPFYYGRLLRHIALSGYINSLSKGIRERSTEFRWNEASNVILSVPPQPEQTRIAAFLDQETAKIDALVEEQERLIALLKEKRQAVISHAVTKGLNPKAPMKPSGIEWLGDVPEHWYVGPVKRLIDKVESGTSVNSTDEPAEEGKLGVLKTSCVYSGKFEPWENKTVVAEDLTRVSCPLKAGTLIVSRMNTPELIGAAGLVTSAPANLFLPDRLWQISFTDTNASFVHYWTLTSLYRAQVSSVCTGTSSTMKNLGQDQFGCFAIATPPLKEQALIAAFLDKETVQFDTLTAEAQRAINLLQERRTALISASVTGQIDVRQRC